MLLGRVAGTLVATDKEPTMEGLKFLVIKQIDVDESETGGYVIAADAVGAGVGEIVMFATGSSARPRTSRPPRARPRSRRRRGRSRCGSRARACVAWRNNFV